MLNIVVPAFILLLAAFGMFGSGFQAVYFGQEYREESRKTNIVLCVVGLLCFGLFFTIFRDQAMELLR